MPSSNYPFKWEPLDEPTNTKIKKAFLGHPDGLIKASPGGLVMTPDFLMVAEDIYNFELRPDDVWIVTLPKSGTTWTQELLWQILNDLKFDNEVPLPARFPFLEYGTLVHQKLINEISSMNQNVEIGIMFPTAKGMIEKINNLPSPRFIKTHLPFSHLPPKLLDTCKVIYVARNPKDVAVSYFHHCRFIRVHEYIGNFDEFWEYFKNGTYMHLPFWPHIEEAWKLKSHPNMLFHCYEDMQKDLPGVIRQVATFFGRTMTDQQVSDLASYLHVDKCKKNPALTMEFGHKYGIFKSDGKFIRKGETGDWKNHFDEKLNKEADKWQKENEQRVGIKFVTEVNKK